MSDETKIAWANYTFSIVWGCSKWSEGCSNCYAETFSKRIGYDVWGPGKPRRTFDAKYWAKPLKWNRRAEKEGVRGLVFCSSMADVFEEHPTVDAERPKLWELIKQTPWLDWQILTKRADRIAANLPADWGNGYENVWLGVSVELEKYVSRFNEHLANIPCAVRFVSYEPALGPVTGLDWAKLNWIIYGGESGPQFRPDNPEWARHVRAKCLEFGIPFFFKQSSGRGQGTNPTLDGEVFEQLPGKGPYDLAKRERITNTQPEHSTPLTMATKKLTAKQLAEKYPSIKLAQMYLKALAASEKASKSEADDMVEKIRELVGVKVKAKKKDTKPRKRRNSVPDQSDEIVKVLTAHKGEKMNKEAITAKMNGFKPASWSKSIGIAKSKGVKVSKGGGPTTKTYWME